MRSVSCATTMNALKPIVSLFESGIEDESSDSSENVSLAFEDEEKINTANKLATDENRRVILWRSLVLLVLLAAGAATSGLTFYVIKNEDDEDFEDSVSSN